MSTNINKVLGELEEDLRQLQTARNQVESVVGNSYNLISSVDNLVSHGDALLDEIKAAADTTLEKFNDVNNKYHEESAAKLAELSEAASRAVAEQTAENLKTLEAVLNANKATEKLLSELSELKLAATINSINSEIMRMKFTTEKQLKTLTLANFAAVAMPMVVMALLIFNLLA